MLTQFLVSRPEELLLVEADEDMIGVLRERFKTLNGEIIQFDFIRFNPRVHFGNKEFGLIGNFPYNISSQILFRMLEFRDLIPEMVGMFQKEVAQRIAASPGEKAYGVITLLIGAYYDCKILFGVEAGSFFPPPKVKSAVIRLTRKDGAELGCDYKIFRKVVKAAFGQRRKMLRNSMKSILKGSPLLKDPFFDQRPEQLSLEQFVSLTKNVESEIKNHDT